MKKIKYFLVAVMAVILCLMCLMTTTFSWFAREYKDGNSLVWQGKYDVSNGAGITAETNILNTSSGEYEKVASNYNFSNSNGIPNGERVCYRTDITNSSGTAQSVSLYLSGLKVSQGNFYLGVNKPLKTYKTYAGAISTESTRVPSSIYDLNVYLGLKEDEYDDLKNRADFIHYYNNSGVKGDAYWDDRIDTEKTGNYKADENRWNGDEKSYKIYAMTIDSRAEKMKFKDNKGVPDVGYYDGQEATISSNNTFIYYEYSYNNVKYYYVELENSLPGAKIERFYSEATVYAGNTVDIPATGHNITYKSSNDSIATVSSSGKVTGKKAGTVKITATSTGIYGDTLESECVVTVKETDNSDIPIVTNYLVPKAVEGKPTTVSVYWYINNEDSETLAYTIDDVYLSL